MKKILFSFSLVFAMMLALAADKGKWTGYISDSNCGAKGAKEGHADCAKRCIKGGASAVFVVDKKVYSIADQKKVEEFIGEKVTITGEIDGDKISIESIQKADK